MTPSVAYLVGYYPAVSHTFIAREIDGLRGRGVELHTFSLRRTPAEGLLTDADRAAAAETFFVLPPDPGRLARAHAKALMRSPRRYGKTLSLALRLSPGGVRNGLWQLFYFVEAVLVRDELARRGVEHLHAHFANAASTVALLAAELDGPREAGRKGGLRWSFTMHGPTEFDDVTRYALAEKVRRAAFVACISDYCRSQLMKLVDPDEWEKLAIVHCGLDLRAFEVVKRGDRPAGQLRVLCVGRLVPDKGQELLLEAVAALRAEGLDARVTLVGDGAQCSALEKRAARLGLAADGAAVFAGAVGQDTIGAYYAAADVFCLASFAEGVPVVLMEAMATGLPVVTTRIMGVPELVEPERGGLLVAPGRADAIADALRRLAEDPELRRTLGEHGRAKVEAEYEIGAQVERLRELLGA